MRDQNNGGRLYRVSVVKTDIINKKIELKKLLAMSGNIILGIKKRDIRSEKWKFLQLRQK